MSDNEEFIREFLDESRENLDELERDFVALENAPDDMDRLSNVFRTIHTIKGTSGFFNFAKLGAIAHAGENLLGPIRDGKLPFNQGIATALMQGVDAIREVLAQIETTGQEGSGDYRAINERLNQLANAPQDQALLTAPQVIPQTLAIPQTVASKVKPVVVEKLPREDMPRAAEPALPEPQPATSSDSEGTRRANPIAPTESELTATSTVGNTDQPTAPQPTKARGAEGSIRVDVGLLNNLMNLVGELVLARNQLVQVSECIDEPQLDCVSHLVNQITSELQEGVTQTRMQPIGNMWSKFPRVVRELAISCGKEVELVMEGQETELDRSLLEAIKDPLTHLIRNSIDHGIETPDQRLENGKPRAGRLVLRSFHEGGLVNIEIVDDGKGIQVERVRDRAVSRGLVSESQSRSMTDSELVQMIFQPGFSTAENVTSVSGRGVGMDVVRTNIERIGGSIDIRNRVGKGTTIQVAIPLTLAIIPAIVVKADEQRFVIPQASVVEMITINDQSKRNAIETINQSPIFRLRGKLLPLLFLDEQLGLGNSLGLDVNTRIERQDAIEIVVLRSGGADFGLVVDAIQNAEEIVVKPLDPVIAKLKFFSGATIMGDGHVILILDVNGLASVGRIQSPEPNALSRSADRELMESTTRDDALLICLLPDQTQVALPLLQVRRLEEFSAKAIEHISSGAVVQYRGEIMPVIDLARTLGHPPQSVVSEIVQVVVALAVDQEVGFAVDDILDVVQHPVGGPGSTTRPGVLGTVVINERVTEILDITGIVEAFAG